MQDRVIRITDSVIVPPAPAVTLDIARRHIRALGESENVLVESWIAAGTSYFEEQTGRQVMRAQREAWLDAFPGYPGMPVSRRKIALPFPPLVSVDAVEYVDGDGVVQAFEDATGSPTIPLYSVRAPQGDYCAPGTIEPLSGMSWPTVRCESDAVRIRYTCGYAETPDDVPALVRAIILYMVAHFDQYRGVVHEARGGAAIELPYGVKQMMDGFKFSSLTDVVLHRGPLPYVGAAWGYAR